MKINTDGVLLGALTYNQSAIQIVDIGTGTGVISLILAQNHPEAFITAIEIDVDSAFLAQENFVKSIYSNQLICVNSSFQSYFELLKDDYLDLIVSNPPFFINALKSSSNAKNLSKHAHLDFFKELFDACFKKLAFNGELKIIVPKEIDELITNLALQYLLFNTHKIYIHSFETQEYKRVILTFNKSPKKLIEEKFVIYEKDKVYSEQYKKALAAYFLNF